MNTYNGFCLNFIKKITCDVPVEDITINLPKQHLTKEMMQNKKHTLFTFLTIDEKIKFCRIFIVIDNDFSLNQIINNINLIYGSIENMLNVHWAFGKYTQDGWVPAIVSKLYAYKFKIDDEFIQKIKLHLYEKKVDTIDEKELEDLLHETGRYLNTKKDWKNFILQFDEYFSGYKHDEISI